MRAFNTWGVTAVAIPTSGLCVPFLADFNTRLPSVLSTSGSARFVDAPLTHDDFDTLGTPRQFGGSGSHSIEAVGGGSSSV